MRRFVGLFFRRVIILNYSSKSVKKAISLTAAAIMAVTFSCSEILPGIFAASERSGIVTADYLNVRSGPGLDYAVCNVMSEGNSVVVIETQDGWHKIKRGNGSYGWVSADYIRFNSDEDSEEESTATSTSTTAKASTSKSSTTKSASKTDATATKETSSATNKTTSATIQASSTTKKATTTTERVEATSKSTTSTTKQTTATKKTTSTTKKTTAVTKQTTTTKKATSTTTKKATTTTTKQTVKKNVDLGNGIIIVTGSYTNLRKGSGTGYDIIRRIYRGTEGGIIQKKGSWFKVKLADSTIGWVSQAYVKTNGFKASVQSTSDNSKIIVSVSMVNVRTIASTSGKLVATIRKNEVYKYSEVKDGWYKIVTPSGASGYVCGDYVDHFVDYAVKGGGKYLWPTQTATRISSYFGPRDGKNHYGLDIAAPGGSQIIAVAAGTVVKNSYDYGGYGYFIVIEQNDGIRTYYGHMRKASFLSVGAKVKAGDTVGIVGSTGRSTGNHLHLEFRSGTKRINPLNYYPNMG